MPSAFIVSQAELLHRTKDPFGVLQRLRDKYATTSFPSQMTRVKDVWMQFEERNGAFQDMFTAGLRSLKQQRLASAYLDKYTQFGTEDLKTQLRQQRIARRGEFSGSKRTDTVIAGLKVLPDYMSNYRLSADDKMTTNKLASESIESRSMKCVVVASAETLVARCVDTVKMLTDDTFMIVAAIGILSGRRSCEILRTGVFEQSSRGAYACSFNGAAKKRGCVQSTKQIPIPCKFKYLSRAVEHIRDKLDARSLTNTQLNARYSHKLGDAAKILTDSLETRFHDLRAVYATVSFNVFDNDCSVNIWMKKVLLHDSIETSVFYSRCKIENFPPKLGRWEF